MTYAQLVASIKTYTENTGTDFVAEIPRFTRMAEDRILHTVQLPEFRRNSTTNFTASNAYLVAPSDFISPYSLSYVDASGDTQFLINKDVNFLREAYPAGTPEADPRFYALWDDATFFVTPTPAVARVVELHYFYKPTSIVDSSTSWLGNNFESALFYGALIEAYIFMKGEGDLMEAYETKYQTAMERLKVLGDGKTRKDMYRSGQFRVPVT